MGNLGTAVLTLAVNSAGLVGGLAAAEAQTTGAMGKMAAAGPKLTRGLTLPILGIGAAAIHMRADFDESMDKVVGLVGISRQQVNAWEEDILKMSTNTARAPKELAEGLFFVTSAGLRGKDALDALEVSAKGAAAGMGETNTIADAVTSAMNAYGKENMTSAHAADVLVAAVRAGKMEASELAPVLGNLLPLASELGVSFEEVAGSIAQMTRLGMKANTAATSTQAIFSGLLKPTKEATDKLAEYGLNVGQLRTIMSKQGIIPMLQLLNDKFHGNVDEMAKVFPNVRALRGVLALAGKAGKDSSAVFKDVANNTGALNNAFKAATGDNFKLAQAFNSLKVAAVQLGGILIPFAATAARQLTALMRGFVSLPAPMQKMIVVGLLLVAAIGPLLSILGRVVLLIRAIGVAMMFLAANPVVLIIAAIVALVAAVIYLWKNNEDFRNAVLDAWDKIKSGASAVFGFVKSMLNAVVAAFKAVMSFLSGHWRTIAVLISGPFAPLVALATNAFGIRSALIGAFNAVTSFVGTKMAQIVGLIGSIIDDARAKAGAIGHAVVDGIRGGIGGLATALAVVSARVISGVGAAIGTAYSLATSIGRAIISGVVAGLGGLFSAIKNKVQSAVSGALKSINPFSPVEHGGQIYIGEPIVEGSLTGLDGMRDRLRARLNADVSAGVRGLSVPSVGAPGGGAGGGGITINFGQVIGAGNTRELARELTRILAPELNRRVSLGAY